MIMNVGITVDQTSELYTKVKRLCEGIEVKFGEDFTIPFPMQAVDTGAGNSECNALRFSVNYRKGGYSFYDGHKYPSSYYLNITPIEQTEHGSRYVMFGGGNCTIAECNRNTPKQRGIAANAVQSELVDIVYKSICHFKITL